MKTLNRSFAGGEITPEMYGRIDLGKFQTGLAKCENGLVLPHGPVARRPGFQFVAPASGAPGATARLIPFAFSATQTMVLEFGSGYLRFHTQGQSLLEASLAVTGVSGNTLTFGAAHGLLLNQRVYITDSVNSALNRFAVISAVPLTTTIQLADFAGAAITPPATTNTVSRVYTVTTPYAAADIPDLHYAQNSDVLTISHPNYPTYELRRLGATNWTLTAVSFVPTIAAPGSVTATATVATGSGFSPQRYVVTTVGEDNITESLASASATCNNNLNTAGNYNTITWGGVGSSSRHNVYKLRGGLYGYIGQTAGVAPTTVNILSASLPTFQSTVTVNTATPHPFSPGSVATIAGTGVSLMNGTKTILTTPTTTQFTCSTGFNNGATLTSTTGTAGVTSCSIIDDNILPDTTKTPPQSVYGVNSEAGAYPAAVSYHEQRRWVAGTTLNPQTAWATRTGTESNLTSSFPSQAADGLQFTLAARKQNAIRHLVPLNDLIALTVGGAFRIYSGDSPAITPTTLATKPQGVPGASNVQPQVTSSAMLYVQNGGKKIREMVYTWQSTSYQSTDVTIMAPHLFERATIVDMAIAESPLPVLWVAATVGGGAPSLYGMTYVPDQQIYAWHKHNPGGAVLSVCVVQEGNEDVLYALINRTNLSGALGGRATVERLSTRFSPDRDYDLYADCGVITPTDASSGNTTVSGLWHLEGQTVQVFLDGAVQPTEVVSNGRITLERSGALACVGLPYNTDIQTLPLALMQAEAGGQGVTKNPSKVAIRVADTSILKVGPSFNKLIEVPAHLVSDLYDSAPALKNQEFRSAVMPNWSSDGPVCIRQDQPLPMTVLSVVIDFAAGG